MKTLLIFSSLFLMSSFLYSQDYAAAQSRADEKIESLTTLLTLTSTQLPQVQSILDQIEKDIETINANKSLSADQIASQIQSKKGEESAQMQKVLTEEQYSKYTNQSNPVPAKSGINTSRSSIKSK